MSRTRIINRQRGTGKTTMLIHASAVTGMQIVTQSKQRAAYINKQAKEFGCTIPETIDAESLSHNRCLYAGEGPGILIDDGEELIGKALEHYLGRKVTAVTISCPMYERPTKEELKEALDEQVQ